MGFLRIILALGVVLYHTGSPLLGYTGINGFIAVHVFFIISGFYMAFIIKNKYSKTKKPYYSFITNRLLRIFPIYWVALLLMILVQYSQINNLNLLSILTGVFSAFNHYLNIRKPFGAIEDFTLIIRGDYLNINMFSKDLLTIGPAWTLVHELIFYLVAPFLLFLKKKYLFLIAVASFSVHFLVSHRFFNDVTNLQSFFIPANFFFFIIGIFSFYLYKQLIKQKIKIKYSFIICLLFLLAVFFWNYIPEVTFKWIMIKEWAIYLLAPLVIPLLFQMLSLFPLNNFMANLSYPVYITHMISIYFLQHTLNYKITEKLFSFWVVFITLTLSILLVYLVEKPLDKIRQKRIKM